VLSNSVCVATSKSVNGLLALSAAFATISNNLAVPPTSSPAPLNISAVNCAYCCVLSCALSAATDISSSAVLASIPPFLIPTLNPSAILFANSSPKAFSSASDAASVSSFNARPASFIASGAYHCIPPSQNQH